MPDKYPLILHEISACKSYLAAFHIVLLCTCYDYSNHISFVHDLSHRNLVLIFCPELIQDIFINFGRSVGLNDCFHRCSEETKRLFL